MGLSVVFLSSYGFMIFENLIYSFRHLGGKPGLRK